MNRVKKHIIALERSGHHPAKIIHVQKQIFNTILKGGLSSYTAYKYLAEHPDFARDPINEAITKLSNLYSKISKRKSKKTKKHTHTKFGPA